MKKIPISEIFYSIQGEGKYCGTPSVFVRVGGCNLRCPGFGDKGCDSYYAVDKRYQKEWELKSIEDIKTEIKKYLKFDPHLVITGGEPTLYFKELYPLIEWFEGQITIETNATIDIDFEKFPAYKKVAFAMSVKLSNSGEEYNKRVKKNVIKSYAKNAKKSFFKFVIDKDLKKEIEDITKNINLSIYCMPLGATKEELEKNAPFVFEFCLKNGYRYSDRIHIRLFGKKKGV
ncbi:7-carboxy-7-deazaguanine synthase QueE [Caminibacter pacificus]|uniref:7-carboxy-7-deazaguanine synthase n=1 Tax=Caminibacter pacificus TaxID=1424653 RepID=A0AAJ4RC03_9BACT|nr:7-carboxy-7-deazaguanine synthase QueE [Caminibacter pacificus]ROR39427.1 organic radical activating enzyme [Caminibacter pacificus]